MRGIKREDDIIFRLSKIKDNYYQYNFILLVNKHGAYIDKFHASVDINGEEIEYNLDKMSTKNKRSAIVKLFGFDLQIMLRPTY